MAEPTRNEVTISYMVTISCQQKKEFIDKVMPDEIIIWLKMCIPSLKVKEFVYENSGKYGQLHFHGIVLVRKGFSYRKFTSYGDARVDISYRIQWTKIEDLQGAREYIKKDITYNSQDEILVNNLFKYKFFNMDTQTYVWIGT